MRDLAAELLHYADPERYPLMTRWVWDARSNTGVLREIWHDDDVDSIRIDVPDGYATFLMLREELAQYLTANGVFRDVLFYVDVLMAQVYAGYIGERGGTYLRTDFATPEDPMLHTRRILGLDGVDRERAHQAQGRRWACRGHRMIHEKSLIRPENLKTHDKLVLDGVDVSGHWSTFIESRVVTDYNERLEERSRRFPAARTSTAAGSAARAPTRAP